MGEIDLQKTYTFDEDSEESIGEVYQTSFRYREFLKRQSNGITNSTPVEYQVLICKLRVLGWFLRSLEAADFSPKHPTFGEYAAASLYMFEDMDEQVTKELLSEYGKPTARSTVHMPRGSSYWQ